MGLKKTFGGDRCVQYLDCGGSFTGTPVSKLSKLCTVKYVQFSQFCVHTAAKSHKTVWW